MHCRRLLACTSLAKWKVGITVISTYSLFIGGIHYPFMEVLGHCKSILSMGNLEGKLLWNIVGISLLAFHKTVVD